METTILQNDRLHYAEVYASDILVLKNLFLQKFGLDKINKNFGIPFLLVKKGSQIVAFASLIINHYYQVDFEIYENLNFTLEEKECFEVNAENYCKRNDSENFKDPEQLKYNINKMIDWLND